MSFYLYFPDLPLRSPQTKMSSFHIPTFYIVEENYVTPVDALSSKGNMFMPVSHFTHDLSIFSLYVRALFFGLCCYGYSLVVLFCFYFILF